MLLETSQVTNIDDIKINFDTSGLWVLNIAIAIIMFGVALGIDKKKFSEVVANPKGILSGVLSQFLLLPLLTFVLITIMRPLPELALGMILVAACPGGNVSNFYTSVSKGNIALSISLTAIATLAAVFMTPLNFTFWSELYLNKASDLAIELDFFKMFKTVSVILGIPLILGLWFAKRFKKATQVIAPPLRILSFLILISIIILAFSKNTDIFKQYYHYVIYIVFIHNAIALGLGYSVGKIARLSKEDCRTISIETGIQNSGLALVIIFTMFDGNGGMALIAAWWGIWHIISGFVMAMIFSRGTVLSLAKSK